MTKKRFTDNGIEEIENQSFTDNLTGKIYWIDHGLDEIIDLLNTQHETVQNLNQRIDDYLTEVNYQLEQGTDFKDTYVRYSRFKQILEELKGVLNND